MSGKWWKCRKCGWTNPKANMVCYCGHSHDALVQSQFNILQGQGVAKTKGKGKGQESSQGNSPKVGKGKGDGKLQPGAVPPSPSGWRSQRKRGAPSEDGSSDAPMNELQERTQRHCRQLSTPSKAVWTRTLWTSGPCLWISSPS